jgi:serine/threonine-protein phosphatase 6 regulatory ankyrin repeat subunit B
VPVDTASGNGLSALFVASQMGHKEIVELLVQSGAVINRRCASGASAMHQAAGFGHKDIIEYLLNNGADPNIANDDGYTPLMAASDSGRVEIVKLLLDAGAKTDTVDDYGMMPLHYAASFGSIDIINYILATNSFIKKFTGGNADINARNKYGHTPLMLAYDHWNYPAVDRLIELGAEMGDYTFRVAAMKNDQKEAQRSIKTGADINAYGISFSRGEVPTTALLAAAIEGHEQMVEFLLINGAIDAVRVQTLLNLISWRVSHSKSIKMVTPPDLELLEAKEGKVARVKYLRIVSKGEERIIKSMLDPDKKTIYSKIDALLMKYSK